MRTTSSQGGGRATDQSQSLAGQENEEGAWDPSSSSLTTQPQQQQQYEEGPPPPVPSHAPRLNLSPGPEDLRIQQDGDQSKVGEELPLIYDVDPSSLNDRPWRRPGADLTDWFNYGFNEQSWKRYGEKKRKRIEEREDIEDEEDLNLNVQSTRVSFFPFVF